MDKGLRRWSAVVFASALLLLGQSLPLLAQTSKAKTKAGPAAPNLGLPSSALGSQLNPLPLSPSLQGPVLGTRPAPAVKVSVQPTAAARPAAAAVAPQAAPAALPASAVPAIDLPASDDAAAASGETVLESIGGKPNHLGRRFDEARAAWLKANDDTPEVAVSGFSPQVAKVHAGLHAQLASMAALPGNEQDPLFAIIARNANQFLAQIDAHIRNGDINPRARLRTSESDSPKPVSARALRVGVYPVAADPFQWAHLLIGLQAIAQLKLDKVVFVLAGDDPRKPNMTKVAMRHPMGKAVLKAFAPFFEYSAVAVGTQYDGETNVFRILKLNPEQRLRAYYLVGDDHYKLKDKNGNDDTLPKLEKNRHRQDLGFDPKTHEISAAFIVREGHTEAVPTDLEVQFLPKIEFEASSTMVRHGRYALMPWSAYDYVRKKKLGLYNIPKD
ncbi:MAG: hypothetical protein WC881_01450 [Elusimicrobiota bacterium]|jgi:hypothetical protein